MISCAAVLIAGLYINPCDEVTFQERQGACRVTTQSTRFWQIADFDMSCNKVNQLIEASKNKTQDD